MSNTSCNQPKVVPEPEIQTPDAKNDSMEWVTLQQLAIYALSGVNGESGVLLKHFLNFDIHAFTE